MRNPVELFFVIVRLTASAVLFSLLLLAAVAYWKHRANPIIKFGGAALLVTGSQGLLVGILYAYWSLLTSGLSTAGMIVVGTIHIITIVQYVLVIIFLLHVLGYMGGEGPERGMES
jgi:hypothetical protein